MLHKMLVSAETVTDQISPEFMIESVKNIAVTLCGFMICVSRSSHNLAGGYFGFAGLLIKGVQSSDR